MNPPISRMMTPAGNPRMAGGLANIGAMKPGTAMNRKAARPMGSPATTYPDRRCCAVRVRISPLIRTRSRMV